MNFKLLVCSLELLRCIYSAKFYQEIDWPCYSLDGKRLLEGDFDYQKYVTAAVVTLQSYLCEWGFMYYPAGFAYVYALIQLISGGDVSIVILIHIVVSVLLTYATISLFDPFMETRDKYLFLLLPFIAQNVYRCVTHELLYVSTLCHLGQEYLESQTIFICRCALCSCCTA